MYKPWIMKTRVSLRHLFTDSSDEDWSITFFSLTTSWSMNNWVVLILYTSLFSNMFSVPLWVWVFSLTLSIYINENPVHQVVWITMKWKRKPDVRSYLMRTVSRASQAPRALELGSRPTRLGFRRLTLRRELRRPKTSRGVPVSSDQSYWRASGTCSRSEQRYTAKPRTKPGLPKGFPPSARLRPLDLTRKARHCL